MEAIYVPLPAENELEVTNFVGRFHIVILFDLLDVARDWLDVFDNESKKRLVDAVGFVKKSQVSSLNLLTSTKRAAIHSNMSVAQQL